jgi:hypothetical protein
MPETPRSKARAFPIRPFLDAVCTVSVAKHLAQCIQEMPILFPVVTQWQQNGMLCRFYCRDRLRSMCSINTTASPVNESEASMQDLWGNDAEPTLPQRTRPSTQHTGAPKRKTAALECHFYGHTWQRIGLSDEKQCTVCGLKGYRPGCTPTPPKEAQPFYCTRHTPTAGSAVQHE